MSRRIDIELTSNRDDGSWTWRAAGAKQPKGVLNGALLPGGAAVGDQLRADVETSLDGTEVLAVLPPKTKSRATAEVIELTARGLSDDELVITTLAPKRGGSRDRGDRGDRGDRRDRGPRREGADRPRREGRPGERAGGPGGDRSGGPRGDRPGGPRGDRPGGGDRPDRPRRDRPAPPAKPKAKRLRPGRAHRKVALDALAPEEQVIAEQVLRGGVPAVRQAVEKMNEEAKAAGRAEVKAEPLLAVAERLLPALRAAEWRDRAEAAVADLDELDLRDLRSVVVAADTGAKDDEGRALAAQLREGLARRVDQEQAAWLAEIAETLGDGRVVRALRLSSRPPKAGAPLPPDLAAKLTEAASAALTADTVTDRWATVLDALSFSPARLTVVPASKPTEPSAELVAAITRVAGRIPKVAEAFGIEAPADTGRRRPRAGGKGAKPGGGRPPKGKGGGGAPGAPPIPPPPSLIEPGPAADPAAAGDDQDAPTAPAAEAPAVETPVADAPATEAAAVEAPATEAPVTEASAAAPAPADAPDTPAVEVVAEQADAVDASPPVTPAEPTAAAEPAAPTPEVAREAEPAAAGEVEGGTDGGPSPT